MHAFILVAALAMLPADAAARTPVACTMQYQPVCGAAQVQCVTAPCHPVYETYGNSCMLNAAGATFVHEGECTADEAGPVMSAPAYTPPPGCVAWFDGCNQCGRSEGGATFCTERACFGDPAPGYCTSYDAQPRPTQNAEVPTSSPVQVEPEPVETEPGFFDRLWQWVLRLFSF